MIKDIKDVEDYWDTPENFLQQLEIIEISLSDAPIQVVTI